MNTTTALTDAEFEIFELDRPAGRCFDLLGFGVHRGGGPVFVPRAA